MSEELRCVQSIATALVREFIDEPTHTVVPVSGSLSVVDSRSIC
jgi:hypothetical protein